MIKMYCVESDKLPVTKDTVSQLYFLSLLFLSTPFNVD